jgi:hypothetical protein
MENSNSNNLLNEDFISKLNEIEINKEEIEAIYYYISLFSESMSDEELVMWDSILEKKDPEYNTYDEETEDSDS